MEGIALFAMAASCFTQWWFVGPLHFSDVKAWSPHQAVCPTSPCDAVLPNDVVQSLYAVAILGCLQGEDCGGARGEDLQGARTARAGLHQGHLQDRGRAHQGPGRHHRRKHPGLLLCMVPLLNPRETLQSCLFLCSLPACSARSFNV